MKKVLIVDDEFLVRLGLKTTIDWEAHGYRIAGEASNGKEALDLFEKLDPDILLTDIKMPVMDGFKLIEEVRKKKKNLKIVILSHYDDFTFAQKAVKYGAVQYILKSEMNEANLLELLQSLANEEKNEETETVRAKIDREDYLKEQLIGKPANAELLSCTFTAPPKNLFEEANHVILYGSCETAMLAENSGDMLAKTVRTILENAFKRSGTVFSTSKDQFNFTSILLVNDAPKAEVQAHVVESMKQLIRNIKQYFDIVVKIGISNPGMPEQFGNMIYQAGLARIRCFFTENSIAVYEEADNDEEKTVRVSHSRLSSYINEDNRTKLRAYLSEIFAELKKTGSYPVFRNALIDLLSIGKSICETYKLDQVPSLTQAKFSYDNFSVLPFISHAETYIQELYDTIADAKTNNEQIFSLAVRNSIAYVKSNYASNISLTDAAEAAEVSSSYLSLIFKQETGVNFSSYLTEYRIEQAKKMLSSTSKKIYEIADEVGFSSPYYFSKVFKEITGLTCKEYKDKYGKTIEDA